MWILEFCRIGCIFCTRTGFSKSEINSLLDWFESIGRSIVSEPCDSSFIDEADKKFYEVAKFCRAKLITGNLKYFPDDPDVLSVAEFLDQYKKQTEKPVDY